MAVSRQVKFPDDQACASLRCAVGTKAVGDIQLARFRGSALHRRKSAVSAERQLLDLLPESSTHMVRSPRKNELKIN